MAKSAVIWFAATCGVAAFVWSLSARMPPDFRGRGQRMGGGAAVAMAIPEDIPSLRDLLARDPRNFRAWFQLATALGDEDKDAEAREAWERAIKAAEAAAAGEPQPQPRACYTLAWAHYKLGRIEEARIHAYKAEQVYHDPNVQARWGGDAGVLHRIGWLRAIQGNAQGARESWQAAADRLREIRPTQLGAENAYDLACNLALLGDKPGAMDMLQRALGLGFTNHARVLHDEDLESIRGEAWFQQIVERMKAGRIQREGE